MHGLQKSATRLKKRKHDAISLTDSKVIDVYFIETSFKITGPRKVPSFSIVESDFEFTETNFRKFAKFTALTRDCEGSGA